MPKIIEYPRASLKASLDLARAVSDLGGSAKTETTAESMKLKVSGAFAALIGAAGKYGLVESSRGQLTITGLYREYKHAYDDNEAAAVLKRAFLNVPLFQKVYDRFKGVKLPVDILGRMFIREFEVDEGMASRVAGYLLDSAKMAKIIGDDNVFIISHDEKMITMESHTSPECDTEMEEKSATDSQVAKPASEYTIHFRGPGIDSNISVSDEDDMLIVQATLNKIKKFLNEIKRITPPDVH